MLAAIDCRGAPLLQQAGLQGVDLQRPVECSPVQQMPVCASFEHCEPARILANCNHLLAAHLVLCASLQLHRPTLP